MADFSHILVLQRPPVKPRFCSKIFIYRNRFSHTLNPFLVLYSGLQQPFGVQSLREHFPDICEIGAFVTTMFQIIETSVFLHGIMFPSHSKSSLKISDRLDFGNPWIQELREISKRVFRRPLAKPRILSRIFLHEITRISDAHPGPTKKFGSSTPSKTGDFRKSQIPGNSRPFLSG